MLPIAKVIETLGSGNKKKYRALFYYLLVKETGTEAVYEVANEEEAVKAPKKRKEKKQKKLVKKLQNQKKKK